MNSKQRIILSTLVIISALLCLFAAALQAGYEHPLQTSDSSGHSLGFNDPLTWELYGILLRSASVATVAHVLGWSGAIYLFFHLIALLFFVINPPVKSAHSVAACIFLQAFAFQIIYFPAGLVGLITLPFFLYGFFAGKIDGESITDWASPFWHLFQTLWFAASCIAGILIYDLSEQNKTAREGLNHSDLKA